MSRITPIKETREVERTVTETVEEETGYRLETSSFANIYASKRDAGLYYVRLHEGEPGWHFGIRSCRDAAAFFTMLADKLEGDETEARADVELDTRTDPVSLYCSVVSHDSITVSRDTHDVVFGEPNDNRSVWLRAGTEGFEKLKQLMADAERWREERSSQS